MSKLKNNLKILFHSLEDTEVKKISIFPINQIISSTGKKFCQNIGYEILLENKKKIYIEIEQDYI
jgi:hypothetical protein